MQIGSRICVFYSDAHWIVRGGNPDNIMLPDARYQDKCRALTNAIERAALMRFPSDRLIGINPKLRELVAKVNGIEVEIARGDNRSYLLADGNPVAEISSEDEEEWRAAVKCAADHIGADYIGEMKYVTEVRNAEKHVVYIYRARSVYVAIELLGDGAALHHFGDAEGIARLARLSSTVVPRSVLSSVCGNYVPERYHFSGDFIFTTYDSGRVIIAHRCKTRNRFSVNAADVLNALHSANEPNILVCEDGVIAGAQFIGGVQEHTPDIGTRVGAVKCNIVHLLRVAAQIPGDVYVITRAGMFNVVVEEDNVWFRAIITRIYEPDIALCIRRDFSKCFVAQLPNVSSIVLLRDSSAYLSLEVLGADRHVLYCSHPCDKLPQTIDINICEGEQVGTLTDIQDAIEWLLNRNTSTVNVVALDWLKLYTNKNERKVGEAKTCGVWKVWRHLLVNALRTIEQLGLEQVSVYHTRLNGNVDVLVLRASITDANIEIAVLAEPQG